MIHLRLDACVVGCMVVFFGGGLTWESQSMHSILAVVLGRGERWRMKREVGQRLAHVEGLERREVLSTLPGGFTDSVIASNLVQAAIMTVAPDGRIFLGALDGTIRVMQNTQSVPVTMGTFQSSAKAGQALLGLVLDPDFQSNGWMYLYRAMDSGKGLVNVLSRVTVSGNGFVPNSEVALFVTPRYQFVAGEPPHNGGGMVIGADGKLYIPTGDQGNSKNAQSLNSLAGKVLRLNRDGSIPAHNPFYSTAKGQNRAIYAMGLRNPYTVAVQPGTGVIYINDVGEVSFEEIDQLKPGANFGWPNAEGLKGQKPGLTAPVYTYSHNDADTNPAGTAVIGGAFYNVAQPSFPAQYAGKYFFADYHNGWIKTLDTQTHQATSFATGLEEGITHVVATPDGRLLYLVLDQETGISTLHQITYAPNSPPAVSALANQTVPLNRAATFQASASGTGPFTYQWYANGSLMAGQTSDTLTLPGDLKLNGTTIRAVATNAFGSASTNTATFTVLNENAPQAFITAPAVIKRYAPGTTIAFAGYGLDSNNQPMTKASLTWTFDLLHNDHTHPGVYVLKGVSSGKLLVPYHASMGKISFRLNLTVTDAAGITTTVSKVFPSQG